MWEEEHPPFGFRNGTEIILFWQFLVLGIASSWIFGAEHTMVITMLTALCTLSLILYFNHKQQGHFEHRTAQKAFWLLMLPVVYAVGVFALGLLHPILGSFDIGTQTYYVLGEQSALVPISTLPTIGWPQLAFGCGMFIATVGLLIFPRNPYLFWQLMWIFSLSACALSLIGWITLVVDTQKIYFLIKGPDENHFSAFTSQQYWSTFALVWSVVLGGLMLQKKAQRNWADFLSDKGLLLCLCFASLFSSAVYVGSPLHRFAAALVIAFFLFQLSADHWQKGQRASSVFSALLCLAAFALGGAYYLNHALDFANGSANGISWLQQKHLWQDAWAMFLERPLFGWGASGFAAIHPFVQSIDLESARYITPYSDLLQALVEKGVIGVVIALVVPVGIVIAFLRLSNKKDLSYCLLAAVFLVALLALVSTPLQSPPVLFSVYFLLACAYQWSRLNIPESTPVAAALIAPEVSLSARKLRSSSQTTSKLSTTLVLQKNNARQRSSGSSQPRDSERSGSGERQKDSSRHRDDHRRDGRSDGRAENRSDSRSDGERGSRSASSAQAQPDRAQEKARPIQPQAEPQARHAAGQQPANTQDTRDAQPQAYAAQPHSGSQGATAQERLRPGNIAAAVAPAPFVSAATAPEQTDFDLIVIGGGSAGYAAASLAQRSGQKVAIADSGSELGGLCILRGCMPSKTLIYSAEVLHLAQKGALFGLNIPAASVDMKALHERKKRVIAEFADYRREQLENASRFTLLRSKATFTSAHTIRLEDGRQYSARKFLVATGSRVSMPEIDGLRETPHWTSDDVLDLDFVPESVIVLGGGIVACELAQFLRRIGSRVTIIQRSPRLLKEQSVQAAAVVRKAFEDEGIEVITGTRLLKISGGENGTNEGGVSVSFEHDGQTLTRKAAHLFNALGRTPATHGLNLEAAGINLRASGHIRTNAFQQTDNPDVYAAGDVCGPHEIVHVAIMQAEVAARHALGQKTRPVDTSALTGVVFTDPQIARVGPGEDELAERGIQTVSASYPFDDHGKSILMEAKYGYVKTVVNKADGRLVAAECVGKDASELIHALAVAVSLRARASDLLGVHWYHPTLAEIWTYPLEECVEALDS